MLRFPTKAIQRILTKGILLKRVFPFCESKLPVEPPPSNSRFDQDSVNKLARYLDQQIDDQKAKTVDLSSIQEAMKKGGWQITSYGGVVELKKTLSGKTVFVIFAARAPFENKEEDEEDIQLSEDEEEEEEPQQFIQFTVYLKKSQQNNELMFADYCIFPNAMKITSIGFTSDYESHRFTCKSNRQATKYSGPDLGAAEYQLSRFLQKYFYEFGIGQDMAEFIKEYSLHAEQPHYVRWLQDIRSFIK